MIKNGWGVLAKPNVYTGNQDRRQTGTMSATVMTAMVGSPARLNALVGEIVPMGLVTADLRAGGETSVIRKAARDGVQTAQDTGRVSQFLDSATVALAGQAEAVRFLSVPAEATAVAMAFVMEKVMTPRCVFRVILGTWERAVAKGASMELL